MLYSYIIVAMPETMLYFLMARDLDEFKDKYDTGARQWLIENECAYPVATKQTRKNCVKKKSHEETDSEIVNYYL